MLTIDKYGHISNPHIVPAICPRIERGRLLGIHGIVVHQTNSSTGAATINSYSRPKAMGAHFLIDRDGTIYQTASVFKQTCHVGRLRARCAAELRCTPVEIKALKRFKPEAEHRREMKKSPPDRFPANHDSLGIEIVGLAIVPKGTNPDADGVYEPVNEAQNDSLRWLVRELGTTFAIPRTEIFRHSLVSFKNKTEAVSAKW
jgi:N-acetyl-anhydromuramyl-L-alanine amidase AmpD